MKHRLSVGMLLSLLLVLPGNSPAREQGQDFDRFLIAYTATWNTHDGNALAALFADDADLIVGNLPRIDGRAAIGASWTTYFSRISENRRGEFELLSLRDIAPGVRLANVRSRTFGVDEDGEELETRLARGTWVLVRSDGVWRIAAMRAQPEVGENRTAPGTDR